MRSLSSLVAAGVCAAALSASAGLANANIARGVPSPFQPQVVRSGGWHYDNGLLLSTPHYMATMRQPRVRPNCCQLVWGGGPVQHPPTIYVAYWGWHSDPSGERPYLHRFLSGVGGSAWLSVDTQYSDGSGHITNPLGMLKKVWLDPSAIPTFPTDSQIANEAIKLANHFHVNSANASYVIATPTGHNSSGFGSSYCAYHGKVVNAGVLLAYTNFPYMSDAGANCGAGSVTSPGTLDGVSIVEGHELAETNTDPDYFTGWNSSGGEIGDLCAWQNLGITHLSNGSNFPVQPLYSNAVAGCVRN